MAGIESMLKLSGVQAMLKNLLMAAAPELGAQVNEIANVILAFKEQCDRIERQQLEIMRHLGISPVTETAIGDLHATNVRGTNHGIADASNGAGKQAG